MNHRSLRQYIYKTCAFNGITSQKVYEGETGGLCLNIVAEKIQTDRTQKGKARFLN